MKSQLAAVLAADIVGYSKLMSDDQTTTLAALRRLRKELFGPIVTSTHGRIIKNMGDGWLVQFSSAVDAVTCAIRVQDNLSTHPSIRLRIGIHIGDVFHEDEDIFGDGVNIAARLQELSQPGGIAISDSTRMLLDGTLKPSFDDQGLTTLKNIPDRLRVWSRGGNIAQEAVQVERGNGLTRLAIKPIGTTSTDAEVRDLASLLTDDLVTLMDANPWLISTISSQPEAGTYIVEGTLRASGNRLRLTVSLETPDGVRLWADKQDGFIDDVFDWQDEVGNFLATHLLGRIVVNESARLDNIPDDDKSADEWYLNGMLRVSPDVKGFRHLIDCMERAIALRPDWGRPYLMAVGTLFAARSIGLGQHFEGYETRHDEWMQQADTLEPSLSSARAILAFAQFVKTGDFELVRDTMTELLRHMPFDPDVLMYGGFLFLYSGDPQPGIDCLEKLSRTTLHTPYAAITLNGLAFGYAQLGRNKDALKFGAEAARINPNYPPVLRHMAVASANSGREEQAKEYLSRLNALVPDQTVTDIRDRLHMQDTPEARRYLDGLRLAGMPE